MTKQQLEHLLEQKKADLVTMKAELNAALTDNKELEEELKHERGLNLDLKRDTSRQRKRIITLERTVRGQAVIIGEDELNRCY